MPTKGWLSVGLALLSLAGFVSGDALIKADDDLPRWASDNTLQLKLSADSTNYAVIPLTEEMARGNQKERGHIDISGNLRVVRERNYDRFNENFDVAYMCCDEPSDDATVDRKHMLKTLIKRSPKAIVLFSTTKNWCILNKEENLKYTSFLSMVDTGEASTVLNHLNDTDRGEIVNVDIVGNTTNLDFSDSFDSGNSGKSTIAMSILYAITGIITCLFLVIIIMGAIRAHRNPERYGPRNGDSGRRGQSRAKGIARAVLETLPVVKFGDRQQPKPDPDLEMETATTDGQVPATQRNASNGATNGDSHQTPRTSMSGSEFTGTSVMGSEAGDENLGCSICTEDFRVGEDVRVLPCNHQYHPGCVDPWLINISGTCPLCRLDLRPGHDNNNQRNSTGEDGETTLPPPLAWDLSDNETAQAPSRNRLSRLFDVNRLRQASVEEQMEVLRRLREELDTQEAAGTHNEQSSTNDTEDRNQGARFTAKLKERFRILTKSQSAQRENC